MKKITKLTGNDIILNIRYCQLLFHWISRNILNTFIRADWKLSAKWQSWNFSMQSRLIKVRNYRHCRRQVLKTATVSIIWVLKIHKRRWKSSAWLRDFLASRHEKIPQVDHRITAAFILLFHPTIPTLGNLQRVLTERWKAVTRALSRKAIGLYWIKTFKVNLNSTEILIE